MQKFRQQASRSRFDKYIINAPHRAHHEPALKNGHPAHARGLSMANQSSQQATALDCSTLNEINSKLSIRSSKERAGSGRVNRREVVNRQMTKTTLRRMKRYNTEQRDPAHDQRIASLKRHVGHLNAACNQLKINETLPLPSNSRTEGYAREERRKFLMGQLCFTEIDEGRIDQQKKFLNNFQHLSRSLPKMVQGGAGGEGRGEKAGEAQLLECLRGIDRIFVVLRQMEFAGYPARSNKFMIDFCTGGRLWLKGVFLVEPGGRRDTFTMAVKYCVAGSPEQAKTNFSAFLASAGNVQPLGRYLHDLEGLYEHLQSSLTEKKLSRLMNVGQELGAHVRAVGERMEWLLSQRGGGVRLTEDLEEAEAQLGPMREISKISRRKFEELSRTYGRLQGVV